MAGWRSRSLDAPSIHSLLLHEYDEFTDDDEESDSDDPLDDSDKDRDCVFGKNYSESDESNDDEHEGSSATTLYLSYLYDFVLKISLFSLCIQFYIIN